MLAERLNVFASRTSKRVALLCAAFAGGSLAGGWSATRDGGIGPVTFVATAAAQQLAFASTQAAYDQGLSAYRGGYFELAIPALEYVITKNDPRLRFFAEFYLARIHSDSAGVQTDHAKAYMFYQRISDENADIDPDDLKRAPIVAKSLTALAIYVRDGLPEIGLKPDVERAVEYLRHAATFFNEPDAQFELAKINIADERERRNSLHFLQKLSKENHPGAQATLADLMARGKYVPLDHAQALALIKMAVDNATPSDRLWIEHIYQNIFCGSSADVREKSKSFVADWRKAFAQPRASVEQPAGQRSALGMPARVCANGERIDLNRRAGETGAVTAQPGGAAATSPPLSIVPSGVRTPAPQR